MNPEISIVIPVYNSESTIEKAIYSVQVQRNTPSFEIICVDDGSTDRSLLILKELAQRDSRIQVLTQQNQFAGVARNRGMAQARGKYLAFLDADDYYFPDALGDLYAKAERYRLDWIKGSFRYIDVQTGKMTGSSYAKNGAVKWPRRGKVTCFRRLPYRLRTVADVPWNGLYSNAFLKKHNIQFNHLRCVNDHSFFIDCLIHAERMMVVDTEVACYHIDQKDSLIGRRAKYFSCCLASYEIVKDLCKELSPKLRQIILQQELTSVFSWYERLRKQLTVSDQLDIELKRFLKSYHEEDVGELFLCAFSFRELYYRLRYDSPPPRGRPSLPARAIQCLQEHGWKYTIDRILKKES